MKVIKTISKTIEERKVIDKTICDICGKEIEQVDNYDRSEVIIGAKLGSYYPEGDCRNGLIIDCCPKCFEEKVVLLIENTFNIKFREFDVETERFDNF
jgi:hypothetical protein